MAGFISWPTNYGKPERDMFRKEKVKTEHFKEPLHVSGSKRTN